MSLSIEEAKFVSNTRIKIVQNMRDERPADEGIDKDELRRVLEIVRSERSLGAAGSGKKSKSSGPVVPIDLDELMGKKSGGNDDAAK